MDGTAVIPPDIVAVGRLRRLSGERSPAMRKREPLPRSVEAVDRLEPLPDRVALPVPGELMGIDQPPGRRGADDRPGKESVAGRKPQIAGRLPTPRPGVVEGLLRVPGERVR